MSDDEKRYTERDLILAKRQGYAARMWESLCMTDAEVRATIAARYPLPKATRPRVVADPHDSRIEWRAPEDSLRSHLFHREGRSDWTAGLGSLCVTRQRVALWADLLANPTEEVDDAD